MSDAHYEPPMEPEACEDAGCEMYARCPYGLDQSVCDEERAAEARWEGESGR